MAAELDWSDWYDMTRTSPPTELLVKTLSYVKENGKALDLGGGALKDSRYLLGKGFEMMVVDKNPLLMKEAEKIKNDRLHPIVASFEDFNFPVNEFDLVLAMHCLSYCKADRFKDVIEGIKSSLKEGGIFCGQMYDGYDEWSKSPECIHRTYQTADEAKSCLNGMDILLFEEEETGEGRTKHWHIYEFIARK